MGEFVSEFKESSRRFIHEVHERTYDAVLWCRDVYQNSDTLRATIDSLLVLGVLYGADTALGNPIGLRMSYILPMWLAAKRGGRLAGYISVAATVLVLTRLDLRTNHSTVQVTMLNTALRLLVMTGLMTFIEHFESRLRKYATMAKKDSLTLSLNRLGLDEYARRAIDKALGAAIPLTIAMIDCDKFKELNDEHGHEYGDHVLQTLAKLLRKHGQGAMLARNGGDEFVLVLLGKSPSDARGILEKVNWKFREQTIMGDRCASFSYGISRLGIDGTNLRDLLVAADKDMYLNKAARSSQAVVESKPVRMPA